MTDDNRGYVTPVAADGAEYMDPLEPTGRTLRSSVVGGFLVVAVVVAAIAASPFPPISNEYDGVNGSFDSTSTVASAGPAQTSSADSFRQSSHSTTGVHVVLLLAEIRKALG